ncbi:hypothetical protein BEL07_25015 [Mycolicibacterium grossiae]|uniref:Uncharacterized protein n=1 Tax=Mycolicibacterium grossiae TaxID=1552759 RepID=A0A1E8PXX9_9MYCO|nr:hypothetical protein BEL07_25015 [Mycolicibacterium grossiae]
MPAPVDHLEDVAQGDVREGDRRGRRRVLTRGRRRVLTRGRRRVLTRGRRRVLTRGFLPSRPGGRVERSGTVPVQRVGARHRAGGVPG